MACNRCKGTSSDLYNFLLSCSECGKNWHHRCHIPPLGEPELVALIRATNDNDVDNGFSSWIGRCCRKKRAKAQATPEALTRPAPSIVEVPRPQLLSVSTTSTHPAHAASIHKVSQQKVVPLSQPTHLVDQTSSWNGVVPPLKSDGEPAASDLGSMGPQTNLAMKHPDAQYTTVPFSPDSDAKDLQWPHETPLPSIPSATVAPPPSDNVPAVFAPYSRAPHLRESSLTLARKSTSRPVEPAHAHVPSQSFNNSPVLGLANPTLTKSEPMDIDPPTLDLRALSFNRTPGPSKASSHLLLRRTTTSRPPSPPPPTAVVVSEDDDMEDLYGPPLGLPSPYAPPPLPPRELPRGPSPSLRYPEEPRVFPAPATEDPHRLGMVERRKPREASPVLQYPTPEPRVLPELAAEDPDILGVLERHVQREAARPRQGMRKAEAVRRAGKRRGGFVLVADRTEVEAARAGRGEPRGVFASYFARSGI